MSSRSAWLTSRCPGNRPVSVADAETTGSCWQHLLGDVREQLTRPWSSCGTCTADTAERHTPGGGAFAVNSTVGHVDWAAAP